MKRPERVIVIGGGIAGLVTATELMRRVAHQGLATRVDLIEAEPWVGGKLRTKVIDGFRVEEAANGWLRGGGVTHNLCVDNGLGNRIIRAHENARKRFIVHHGRLRELPTNPLKLATSDLLSMTGRFRLAREPFIAPSRLGDDESVAAFGRRRVGKEATELLVDPMVTGIYAGDPERLSMASTYPKLLQLERTHGSLVKGMMATQKAGKDHSETVPDSRALESLEGGMSELCEGLRAKLNVTTGRRIVRVERSADRYTLHDAEGRTEAADVVVMATPAEATARMLASFDDGLARDVGSIRYNGVAVVALGFRKTEVTLHGFGFLAPHRENRRLLGTLIDSNVFDNRAPNDFVLMRTIVGGTRRPEILQARDDELVTIVRDELAHLAGIRGRPEMVEVIRHPRAIAQYELGHAERLARIEKRAHPDLYLTGSAYRGVAVNDCVADALQTAARILPG